MTDLAATIAPKSDQLNSDDLITGPRTIKITKVTSNGSPDQPISISFEGDDNKPYKPCKGMRRVLVHCWGRDGAAYVGRSMTLYRDPGVVWGGVAVGGIRISHMTDIPSDITLALTASKTSRKPFTVKPLKVTAQAPIDPADIKRKADIENIFAICRKLNEAGDSIKWSKKTMDDYVNPMFEVETGTDALDDEQLGQLTDDLTERLETLVAAKG